MFRNLLSSGGGDKTGASIKSDTTPPTNTTTTTSSSRKTPKDQCPHCNHSFFSSLKSHLRLNKSCGTKTLVSEPRINKSKSSSTSSNNTQNEIKSKAMLLMMAKQTKLDNMDNARLSTNNNEPNTSSPSNNIELPSLQ